MRFAIVEIHAVRAESRGVRVEAVERAARLGQFECLIERAEIVLRERKEDDAFELGGAVSLGFFKSGYSALSFTQRGGLLGRENGRVGVDDDA
ncbi:MAG: hypothetical protein M5R36_03875 [Deltaproteobacteria bacterium]|nr:hypothetical protein [Deltaproteobacteria bacterium]